MGGAAAVGADTTPAFSIYDAQYVDIVFLAGPIPISDPKDVIYVLTACARDAFPMLTGDRPDFIESHHGGAQVLSVRQFLALQD
ncbi:MAG: hypothetical protein ACOVN0_09620 [Niveispirillum sp.]|uniref:hypothetical protein n=1 Tax=Niveispirillum sp. TaxID=1917217 RepID=UPI003BA75423